ncbi:MAG: DUF3301 domain-containing protein [Gammaproteobacteria bacterium]|nr:DUF3301 domain-containing protein [Gammaproteobacteria bacterium]
MFNGLLLLVLVGALLGLWQWSVKGREQVLAISREVCRDLHMQRLDDSVALNGMRLVRSPHWALERRYEFEFSADGADRCKGQVFQSGLSLQRVRLEMPSGPLIIEVGGRRRS